MFPQCVLLLSLNWDTNMWTSEEGSKDAAFGNLADLVAVCTATKALDVPTEKVSCSPLLATSFEQHTHLCAMGHYVTNVTTREDCRGSYKLHDVNFFVSDFVSVLFVSLSCRSVLLRAYLWLLCTLLYYGHCGTCAEFTADSWTQENREGPRLHLV